MTEILCQCGHWGNWLSLKEILIELELNSTGTQESIISHMLVRLLLMHHVSMLNSSMVQQVNGSQTDVISAVRLHRFHVGSWNKQRLVWSPCKCNKVSECWFWRWDVELLWAARIMEIILPPSTSTRLSTFPRSVCSRPLF